MSYTLPAGTYVVGDPCYNLSDSQYEEFLISSASLTKEGEVFLPDGTKVKIYAFDTATADSRFVGQDRFEYAVDSASIGIIPLAALEGREADESTKVVKFKQAFEVYDSGGTLVFGHIEINTNGDIGHAEDDDDGYELDEF